MKKKLAIILIFVFSLVFGLGGVSCYASNPTKKQIDEKRSHAKRQIIKIKLLEKLETNKLYTNQKKLEQTETSLNNNKIQYKKAKEELSRLQTELKREMDDFAVYQAGTNKRIVQIFKSKRSGYVEFLLSSGDLNDFLDRIYYENIIMQIDKKNMDEARVRAASIKNLKASVEKQK